MFLESYPIHLKLHTHMISWRAKCKFCEWCKSMQIILLRCFTPINNVIYNFRILKESFDYNDLVTVISILEKIKFWVIDVILCNRFILHAHCRPYFHGMRYLKVASRENIWWHYLHDSSKMSSGCIKVDVLATCIFGKKEALMQVSIKLSICV